MTNDKWAKIGGIILSAVLAIAAVFGWFLPVEMPEERAIRERIAFDARDDSYLYGGADLYMYSDDHASQVLHIDGATGNIDTEGTITASAWITDGLLYIDGGIVAASGAITFTDPVLISNTVTVGDDIDVDGTANLDDVDVDGTLDVAGITTLASGVENFMAPSIATATITYTAGAGGSGTVATIGDGEIWLILGVYANVTTDWDTTAGDDAYCSIGDGNDPDGLLDLDDAELQAADTEGTGAAAGWQGFMSTDTRGAYLASTPFLYAPSGAAETIDWICGAAGDDLEAGEATIYVLYLRIQ